MMTALALIGLPACYDDEPDTEIDGEIDGEVADAEVETDLDEDLFGGHDADADQALAREEWDIWWADGDLRDEWDIDDEEGLNRDEFAASALDLWDLDDDGRVAMAEWTESTDRWFATEPYGNWEAWDTDADGFLDEEEVRMGWEREALYAHADANDDGLIDDGELSTWFFEILDVNDDGIVDATEWDRGTRDGYIG
jgi:hypothetical protein